jgi:hypothetical protein
MENKEYFLLGEEYIRPLDGKWTDKLTMIPPGTIIHEVRKRDEATEGYGFEFKIKATGEVSILYNISNVIENTPANREVLGRYREKKAHLAKLNSELGEIIKQFVTLVR